MDKQLCQPFDCFKKYAGPLRVCILHPLLLFILLDSAAYLSSSLNVTPLSSCVGKQFTFFMEEAGTTSCGGRLS
eukprot:584744-Pelagomonas_calceolata.AAC.1